MRNRTYTIIAIVLIAIVVIGVVSYIYYPKPASAKVQSTYTEAVVLPFVIDPAMAASGSAPETAFNNLYDDLVYLGANNTLVPNAAQSWNVSQDGLTYTFVLRQGIKWHDGNGTMNAEDVVFSMNRLLTIGQGVGYLYAPFLASVTAVDQYTVQFNLNQTFGPFVASLQKFFIVEKSLILAHIAFPGSYGAMGDYGTGWMSTHDAGSGAYMVKSFDPATGLVADLFTGYWGEVMPNAPDVLQLLGISDPTVITSMFKDRTLENAGDYASDELCAQLAMINGVSLYSDLDSSIVYTLSLNTKIAPLDDIHVRLAMFYAFNYTALQQAFSQYWTQFGNYMATNIVTNWLPGADPTLNQPFQQNLTLAKQELSESKYASNITDYTIEYDYVTEVAAREKLALVFASSMTELGLNVKTVSTPWATMLSKFADESMPVVEIGFYLDYAEAVDELQSRYSTATDKTFYNNAHIDNQTIDNTIDQIISNVNATERYQEEYALEHTMLNMCVDIPLVQWQFYTAYQSGYVDLSQALKIPDFFSVSAFCRLIQEYPAKRAALL